MDHGHHVKTRADATLERRAAIVFQQLFNGRKRIESSHDHPLFLRFDSERTRLKARAGGWFWSKDSRANHFPPPASELHNNAAPRFEKSDRLLKDICVWQVVAPVLAATVQDRLVQRPA